MNPDPPVVLEGLDRVIEDACREVQAPGVAVGVVHGDDLVYFKGAGLARIETASPVQVDTTFRLASISKVFTTVAIMQLVEAGKLDLDAPVNEYLVDGRIDVKPGWPDVTARHLLAHVGGFGELFRVSDAFRRGFGLTVIGKNAVVPPLSSIHARPYVPNVPAGSKHAYSNIGFSLLGYVLEQVTGDSFEHAMRERILVPLEMHRSDFARSPRVVPFEATGYKRSGHGWRPATYYQNIISPAGNLISCVEDMARFASMLLGRGETGGKRLLGEVSIDAMTSPQYWAHEGLREHHAMGLAMFLHSRNGTRVVEHGGATSGYTSYMTLVPSMKLALLVFSNKDEILGTRGTATIKERVLSHLVGARQPCAAGPSPAPSLLEDLAGWYGAPPGFLTSTRIYMYHGGDARVSTRGGQLVLSTLYGPMRHGVPLRPCHDPLVFETGRELVTFHRDAGEKASAVSTGLVTLVRRPLVATFRFKLVMLVVAFALVLALVAWRGASP